MGIESGFGSSGFVDDRAQKAVWNEIEEKISKKQNPEPSIDSDDIKTNEAIIDGKLEMPDTPAETDWKAEMQISNKRSYQSSKKSGGKFFQRNKRQIFDALIILGVVFVAYKLFWEKSEGDSSYGDGGDVDYTPRPSIPQNATPEGHQSYPIEPSPPEPSYNQG
jgi:hypothetical protein|tara:strand:+ start:2076 stop:2567 length:492 start_codon:yes stop_codon:yes gene_type:complete